MGAVDRGLVRQGGQPVQRIEHLGGRALEQAAAASTEKRIPAEKSAMAVVGNVAQRVSRHADHAEIESQVVQRHAISIVQGADLARQCLARRTERGCPVPGGQRADAADVIRMVVRDENRAQFEALGLERSLDCLGISRVDDDRRALVQRRANQPEVVVRKRPDRAHREHGTPAPEDQASGRRY